MTIARKLIPVTPADQPVDIIWNFTLVCPFDCKKCCVAATHVKVRKGLIEVRNGDLTEVQMMPFDRNAGSPYAQVARDRQAHGLELDLAGKHRVLDNLAGVRPKLDFSGGDPLVHPEAMQVLREASRRFGPSQITVTATGAGLHAVEPEDLAPYIGELNFTYDGEPPIEDPNCPPNYAKSNLRQAGRFAELLPVRAELPLTLQNIARPSLTAIFTDLHQANIPKLLVMRLFEVGRGQDRGHQVPTKAQYREAIALLMEMEAKFGWPKIKLQCALRGLSGSTSGANPCDAIRESFGLMSDGTLLGSPWAINKDGRPLDDIWILGNLSEKSMVEILASERVVYLRRRLDEAHSHCKIQSFQFGASADPLERMLEAGDPLYSPEAIPDNESGEAA